MAYPETIRHKLDIAIDLVVKNKKRVVKNPDKDFSRNRKLTLRDTIALLLSMSGGSLQKELYTCGADVTASAFVQSRQKILPRAFRDILRRFNHTCNDRKTYRQYRIYAVDGSCINLTRNPNAPSFVCNDSNPHGYNQLHLNALYDLENKVYSDAVIQAQPCADEIGALSAMLRHRNFHHKSIIIMDRGYESYNLFAHLMNAQNIDFLCRIKQDRSCMKAVQGLPMEELDKDVSFTITNTQTNEDKRNGYIFLQKASSKSRKKNPKTRAGRWDFPSPYPMSFRVVRFLLPSGEYETLATSLPRSFTIEDIKELYHRRWGIETSFRELKYNIGLTNLHGKSDAFVEQEIYAAMIMYNFSTRIAGSVVVQQKKKNIYCYRVNFTMAVFLCREFFRDRREDGEMLIQAISRYVEPVRPGRQDIRKLRPKGFVGFTYRIAA